MIVSAPDRLPTAVGVNVALTVQLAPAAKVLGDNGQFEVAEKSPVTAMEQIVSTCDCVFVSVRDLAAVELPTS